MGIFIIAFIICFALASLDTKPDEINVDSEKHPQVLREDSEFVDLITNYLKGDKT